MTTLAPSLPMNEVLSQVAQWGLTRVDFEVVKAAALAVWYGTEAPDFAKLKGPHFEEAVLLVERLSYYNVVPQSRKKALLGCARRALETRQGVARTEFESVYKTLLPRLQPLQTRHYTADA